MCHLYYRMTHVKLHGVPYDLTYRVMCNTVWLTYELPKRFCHSLSPATKLRHGNVFTLVCNFVHREKELGVSAGSLSSEVSVQGGFLSRRFFVQGVSVQGGFPVQGVSKYKRVSVQGESLSGRSPYMECILVGCIPTAHVTVREVSLTEAPPGQRPPGQRPSWTQTPLVDIWFFISCARYWKH